MTFKEIGLDEGLKGYFWFMICVFIILILSLAFLYLFMWICMVILGIKIFPAFLISLAILGYIFHKINIYLNKPK